MNSAWQPPAVGEWFRLAPEPPFEVVAVDSDSQTVGIQYFDGTLEEIDFDSWVSLNLVGAAEPEDWTGAIDISDTDGHFDSDTTSARSPWRNPLENIDLL